MLNCGQVHPHLLLLLLLLLVFLLLLLLLHVLVLSMFTHIASAHSNLLLFKLHRHVHSHHCWGHDHHQSSHAPPPAQYHHSPIMENGTCKNKPNIDGERVEWFLIQDLKFVLQNFKCPLNRNSKTIVFEIEQFLCSPRIVLEENSLRWYLVFLKGGRTSGRHTY